MHDPEPNADAQREQALTSCPDELAERLLDRRWERTLDRLHGRDDLRRGWLLHGGSSCPRGLGWRLSRWQHERTRREDRRSKFYVRRAGFGGHRDGRLLDLDGCGGRLEPLSV